jgi:short-subunit dehydrogenase involved in D-alanine esterification of teichoic acids
MKDSGKTVLITDGTPGIGYAFAEAFLARKNEVKACGVAVQSEREPVVEWATS